MENQNLFENVYKIRTADNEHTVKVSHLGRNDPLVVFVDGALVKKIQRTGALFPSATDTFLCDGQSVELISFGNKEDLAVDGILVKSRKKYERADTKSAFRKILSVISVLLNLLIPIVLRSSAFVLIFGILLAVNGGVWALMAANSPLNTDKKAILKCLGITAFCWLIALLFNFSLSEFI